MSALAAMRSLNTEHTTVKWAPSAPSTHFDEGYEACIQGKPFESNPYSGYHGLSWEDGYVLALRETGQKIIFLRAS